VLARRILDEACRDAEETKRRASDECEEITSLAKKEKAQKEWQAARQREKAINAILERSRTNAELEARKEALFVRRELLNGVFSAAYDKLCALPEKERAGICKKILLREAGGGEKVMPGFRDAGALSGVVEEVSRALEAQGKKPLVFDRTADIEYGFILAGASFEKDCSFRALIDEARALESGVADILFG
jgi:vacuolar-type H+-ATPase subunit E/Vma4